MEFLDFNVTKDSSFLLYASWSLFYWRVMKKTILFSGFKNSLKKICETSKLESIHEKHSVERKNEGRKPDKTRVEKTLVYAQKSRLKMPFKNSMSGKDFVSYSVGLYGSNRTLSYPFVIACTPTRTSYKDWIVMYVQCARQSSGTVHFFGPSLPPPPTTIVKKSITFSGIKPAKKNYFQKIFDQTKLPTMNIKF
jgi:hypothetical protein